MKSKSFNLCVSFWVWRWQCLQHFHTLASFFLAEFQEKHSTWFHHSLLVVFAEEDSLTHQSLEIVIFLFIIHIDTKQNQTPAFATKMDKMHFIVEKSVTFIF